MANKPTIRTLKQIRLAKEVLNPENKTLLEAGNKAGYKSKQIYRESTKQHLAQTLSDAGLDKEGLKVQFKELSRIALEKNDLSNCNRALENITRIQGLFKDVSEVKSTITEERKKELDTYYTKLLDTNRLEQKQ